MEQGQFVFGTGKSNLFKKRKPLAARINVTPSIVLQDTIAFDGFSPDDMNGFDDNDSLEDYESVSSDSNEIPADLEDVPSFLETGPDIENSDLAALDFNEYLNGAILIQGGFMKV